MNEPGLSPASPHGDIAAVRSRLTDDGPLHYFDCDRFEVYNYGLKQGKCDCTATEDVAALLAQPTTGALLAWCDHVERKAPLDSPRDPDPRVTAYADGFRHGVLEAVAQVRQAVLHGFDPAALDGRALT